MIGTFVASVNRSTAARIRERQKASIRQRQLLANPRRWLHHIDAQTDRPLSEMRFQDEGRIVIRLFVMNVKSRWRDFRARRREARTPLAWINREQG